MTQPAFHTMFQMHDAVMLLIDPKTARVVDANRAAARFYGYSCAQLCGMSINDINILKPVTSCRWKAWQDHLRLGEIDLTTEAMNWADQPRSLPCTA